LSSIKQRTHVDAVRDDIANVPAAIDYYSELLKDANKDVSLKGKSIQQANVEQISYLVYYDQIKVDVKAIHDHMELLVDRVRGQRWREFTEKSSIDLSARDKDNYIKQDPNYCAHFEVYLMVKELYERAGSVVDTFINRGYALNNITRARCSDVHDSLL
jgi:hypothetical protein